MFLTITNSGPDSLWVGILKLTTGREASSEARERKTKLLTERVDDTADVFGGVVTFDAGTESEDHFVEFFGFGQGANTFDQLSATNFRFRVFLKNRDQSTENKIETLVGARLPNGF